MKRKFIIGDEWMYYKIYCGYHTADWLVSSYINPLCNTLINNGTITDWFFIRYADPEPHVRWRLKFGDKGKIGVAINCICATLSELIDEGLIDKVVADTYNREIERYGNDTIALCEQLFCLDSRMVSAMLEDISVREDKDTRRWLFSLKSMDSLLDDFGLGIEQRHGLLKDMADDFGREFGITEFSIGQFSDKYRTNKNLIYNVLQGNDNGFAQLYEVIRERSDNSVLLIKQIKEILNSKSDPKLNDVLRSLIHMNMNRIFPSQQRKHEVVLYGFLERYYRSEVAKKKYMEK